MAAALFAIGIALLLTGRPQKMVVERVASGALGASVEIEWGGFLGDLRIDSIRVYGRAGDRKDNAPFLSASGIRVDYGLGGPGGIAIASIAIDELVVLADGSEPDDENYAFIFPLLEAEPGAEDPAYMPKRVSVASLTVGAEFADAAVSLEGFQVDIYIESSEVITVAIKGDSLTGWVESSEFGHAVQGAAIDATISLVGERIESAFQIMVPDYIEVEGLGTLKLGEGTTEFGLAFDLLTIDGRGFGEVAEQFTGIRVAFDEVQLRDVVLAGDLASGEWPEAIARVEVSDLSIGDLGNELYEGDLRVSLTVEGGATAQGEVRVTFAEDSELDVNFSVEEDGLRVAAGFSQWTKEELLEVLPVALRGPVGDLAFSMVSGSYEANWSGQDFDVDMRLESSAADGSSLAPLLLALDAKGTTGDEFSLEGELEARLGDEIVEATAYYGVAGGYRIDMLIGDVGLGPWASLFAWQGLPEGASATLGGTLHAESAGGSGAIEITPNLRLSALSYGDIELDSVDIAGTIGVSGDFNTVHIERLSAEAGDYITRLALEGWDYDLGQKKGGGRFEGALDIALVSASAGLADLYGEVSFEGQLRLDGDEVSVLLSFASGDLGYGDLALPYGTELRGGTTVVYAIDKSRGTLHEMAATIGEGTSLILGDIAFTASPFHARGEMEFESDLQVLVDLAWFKSAEGKASERSTFEISEDGMSVDWHFSFDAVQLVLPDDAAVVSGMKFSAEGSYDGELDGAGTVYVSEMSVAGGTLRDLEGDAELSGTRLIIPSAKGRLFEGWIEARFEVGLLEENAPVTLAVKMTGLDLVAMTEEVQPPKAKLTGFADGELEVEYSLAGLQGMYLKLSSDENFSVNRELVEELLQSESFLSGAGANVVEKAMAKLLGEEPQRPFDSGTLYLYLTEDEIQGVVSLKSVLTKAYNGLNLTVNLDMDQSALTEALKMLEESAIADMEF